MASINTLIDNSNDIIYPITGDSIVYHNNNPLNSLIGDSAISNSITTSVSTNNTDITNLESEVSKIESLKTLVSATDSTPDSIVSGIETNVSESGNKFQIIEDDTLVEKNILLYTIDVASMSDSDRTELGTLLNMEITSTTKLYAYYLHD